MADKILPSIDITYKEDRVFPIASRWKRFTNFMIDLVGFVVISVTVGIFWNIIAPHNYANFVHATISSALTFRLILAIAYFTYYFLSELFLDGKTLGKLITKSRAVDIHRNPPTVSQLLKRSVYRLIPFEMVSFLIGHTVRGWHDEWSDTYVIRD